MKRKASPYLRFKERQYEVDVDKNPNGKSVSPGSFSEILYIRDIETSQHLVLKLLRDKYTNDSSYRPGERLHQEVLYQKMASEKGLAPQILDYGLTYYPDSKRDVQFILMEDKGESLDYLDYNNDIDLEKLKSGIQRLYRGLGDLGLEMKEISMENTVRDSDGKVYAIDFDPKAVRHIDGVAVNNTTELLQYLSHEAEESSGSEEEEDEEDEEDDEDEEGAPKKKQKVPNGEGAEEEEEEEAEASRQLSVTFQQRAGLYFTAGKYVDAAQPAEAKLPFFVQELCLAGVGLLSGLRIDELISPMYINDVHKLLQWYDNTVRGLMLMNVGLPAIESAFPKGFVDMDCVLKKMIDQFDDINSIKDIDAGFVYDYLWYFRSESNEDVPTLCLSVVPEKLRKHLIGCCTMASAIMNTFQDVSTMLQEHIKQKTPMWLCYAVDANVTDTTPTSWDQVIMVLPMKDENGIILREGICRCWPYIHAAPQRLEYGKCTHVKRLALSLHGAASAFATKGTSFVCQPVPMMAQMFEEGMEKLSYYLTDKKWTAMAKRLKAMLKKGDMSNDLVRLLLLVTRPVVLTIHGCPPVKRGTALRTLFK